MNQKKLGIGVIIQNQNSNFLLHLRDGHTKNMSNQWSLIGGEVEKGEAPIKAAIREVKEETNLLAKNLTVFTNITFNDKWDAIIFCAQVNSSKQKMILHEGKKLTFFPKGEMIRFINNLSYTNPFLEVLKKYLNN